MVLLKNLTAQFSVHISLGYGSQNLNFDNRMPDLTRGSVKFGHFASIHTCISHKRAFKPLGNFLRKGIVRCSGSTVFYIS